MFFSPAFFSVFKGEPLKLLPKSWYQNGLWLLSSTEQACVTLMGTIQQLMACVCVCARAFLYI